MGFFYFVQFIVVLGERSANFLIPSTKVLPLSSATFEYSFIFEGTTQSHDLKLHYKSNMRS